MKAFFNLKNFINCLSIVLFLAFAYLFTSSYLSKETPLYMCDLVEQNLFWHDFALLLKNNISQFFETLRHDIYFHNRNPFSILPLLPFAFFMKDFRLGFIFAVETVYMLPVMLLIWNIFNIYFLKKELISNNEYRMFLSSIFLFPALWYSVLSGLPDICGMVYILICFILYFKYGFNKKVPLGILVIFSMLLYLAFLSRRWYSVVIFSFCASIFIENVIISIKNSDRVRQIAHTAVNLSIASVIFCILANIFQGGYFRDIIKNELLERSVYVTNFNQLNMIVMGHLGLFIFFIALVGCIFSIKNRLIRFSAFNIFIYLFMYIVVMNNQLLWINHFIYIAVLVCILFCAGLYKIVTLLKNQTVKNIFAIIVILFNILNFYTFFKVERPEILRFLLPHTSSYPIQSKDYDKIKELYLYLENEYVKDNNIKVTIYGLCNKFGYWQLRSINPDSYFAKNVMGYDRILNSDFSNASYDEDFAILFEPLGIYAGEEVSTKIREIGSNFKNNTGFAKNYKKVKEIELQDENKTKIMLYKKKEK